MTRGQQNILCSVKTQYITHTKTAGVFILINLYHHIKQSFIIGLFTVYLTAEPAASVYQTRDVRLKCE